MTAVNYAASWTDDLLLLSHTLVGRLLMAMAILWAAVMEPLWEQLRTILIVSFLGCGILFAIVFRNQLMTLQSRVFVGKP